MNGNAHSRHELDVKAEALALDAAVRAPAQPERAVSLSFDAVYTEHVSFVWRVLRGMGISDAGVEDAVQEVFIVVHRRLPEFDGQYKRQNPFTINLLQLLAARRGNTC